tara:strand:- start:2562 stop:2918 length:357 start_codon:yes stop_codon:yes gene_type:complete
MPKIMKINCDTINVNGSCLQGYVNATYDELVSKLGSPGPSFDGYKSDAEWHIEFEDGSVATIYNWKDGFNYCGENGTPIENIKEWHIGGNTKSVEGWVNDLIHSSWPAFDEIRQEAQF